MAEKSPASAQAHEASRNPTDPQLYLKKRARRRLVGATALALLAVIVLPMVMDQEARPPVHDVQIRIPSQDPAANTVISRITPRQATAASAPAPSALDTLSQALPADLPVPPVPTATSKAGGNTTAPTAEVKPAAKPETPHHAEPVEKTTEKTTEKPLEKPRADESVRAAALLNDEHWIVQLGAYQELGNVKLLQSKLKELGYPSYTEKVASPNGSRIRVRCGPFPSRSAAEKAQIRLKKIGAGGPSGGTIAQAKP